MANRQYFEFAGRQYNVGDLPVTAIEALEVELGCTYAEIHTFSNMRHKLAMIRALFVKAGQTPADAAAATAALTLDDVEDGWKLMEDDLPDAYLDGLPNRVGEHSTVTS